MKKHIKCTALLIAAAAVFSACNTSSSYAAQPAENISSQSAEKAGTYTAPPFAESAYNEAAAQGENGVLVDISSVSKGYIAVSAQNEKRLKLKITKDGFAYTFNLPSDGTPAVFSLSMGSGSYELKALQLKNEQTSEYVVIYKQAFEAELESEQTPFLRPIQYCNYNPLSDCVKKAASLAAKADTDAEVAAEVYAYIKDNIKYDKEKAKTVKSTYVPNPDETLSSGKGICSDYASLAAAMLRSQGIPAKIIIGNVAPNDLSHAWNMVWLEETGWVTVEIKLSKNVWERIDLTFAAGGAGADFVGDGSNYTDMFVY